MLLAHAARILSDKRTETADMALDSKLCGMPHNWPRFERVGEGLAERCDPNRLRKDPEGKHGENGNSSTRADAATVILAMQENTVDHVNLPLQLPRFQRRRLTAVTISFHDNKSISVTLAMQIKTASDRLNNEIQFI